MRLILLIMLTVSCVSVPAQDARRYPVMDETEIEYGKDELLRRPEVQEELSLTHAQLNKIGNSRTEVPLDEILTASQSTRLDQLLIQMRGPAIILTHTNMQRILNISSDQLARMNKAVEHYEYYRWPLVRRYGRQQVAGIVRQTTAQRIAELDALELAITELLKDRDQDLLLVLTDEQKKNLEELKGEALSIQWPKHRIVFGDTVPQK